MQRNGWKKKGGGRGMNAGIPDCSCHTRLFSNHICKGIRGRRGQRGEDSKKPSSGVAPNKSES